MKCSKCKAKLKKNMRYCPACGTKVVRRSKRWISVLLVISLFVGTAFGGWAIGTALAKRVLGPSDKLDNVKINSTEAAIAFSKELGKELGYENALSELTEKITTTVDGDSYYRLQQNYQGIPVYGKTVVYTTDSHGSVTSVTGNVVDVIQTINVNPTITQSQLMDSIKKYVEENLEIDSIDGLIPDELKGNLCIVITPESGTSYLAYEVQIGGYKVLIDAHSAEILTSSSTIMSELTGKQTVLGYKASDVAKENGFPIDKKTDDYYIMRDTEKNISVYTLNNRNSMNGKVFEPSRGSIVESTDTIFGNSEVEAELEYETGAQLLINVIKIYEYFSELGFIPSVPKINLYYNDGYDSGNNALGGADAEYAMVSMGSNTGVNCVDAIAHEYTHFVSREIVDWIGASENGALNEAFSDIFGVMIEAKVKKNEIDWNMFNLRNVADPSSQGYPETLADENNSGEDYVHGYSTVISHAAYLMWNGINGRESYKINADDLAKLWYRAMLMMPSDCNFVECRILVELAASSMKLTDSQKQCVSEAFDAVGIVNTENTVVDYELAPNCKLQVIGKDDKPYDNYTVTISYYSMAGSYAKDQPLFVYRPQYNIEPTKVTTTKPFSLPSEEGIYKVSIFDNLDPSKEIVFSIQINSEYIKNSLTVYTNFEKPLVVNITDSTNSDAYNTYRDAMRVTTASGKWRESMNLTANMAVTNGNTKTKTKMTMTSDADISNYSESDPSRVHMSGTAEMSVMGQMYAWNMQYENGMAHYQYTRPNQTSADIAIDPSFFNFSTITSDMMTKAKMSGNQITFTVPGEKITEVGIAAVNQMSGVDDLKYGDVDVTVTISNEGTIDTITMVFHASLKYQGYDADVDYDIAYHFSQNSTISNIPSVSIVPCSYTNQENKYDILTVHEVNGNQIVFSVWWYRIWDISNATATLSGNVASFDYYDANYSKKQAKGTIEFSNGKAILTISECSNSYIHQEPYHFNFLAERLNDQQLKEISRFLGVPDDLDVTIKQGTPYYWEGVGIYCTEVAIYYNGELIAGADVNSLTGAVTGGIYTYSGHS